MELTQSENKLIREGFEAVLADKSAATALFYKHLFEKNPELRSMFIVDLDKQRMKLAQTLDVLVAQMDDSNTFLTTLNDLALRHLAYGVRPEHYDLAGEALQYMLAEMIGGKFTSQMAAAWATLYDGIAEVMIDAAYPPSPMRGTGGF